MDQFKPYLSDEVLWACINRDPELDDIDLYKILLDNSPLSIPLANYLPQLNNILTSTQINDLISVQGGLSARDDKEHEIRWHEQQAELALGDILRLFLYDTVPPNPIDSMIFYLEDWGSEESQEMLIGLYWQKENYSAAQSLINTISSNETNSELASLYQKIHDVYSSDDSLPSLIGDTLFLDSVALESTHGGQAIAKQLMWFLTGKEYPRYFQYLPESGSRAESQISQSTYFEELSNEKIRIYPNPNTGKFRIEIEMDQEVINKLSYEIILLNGSRVFDSPTSISSHHTLVELPTRIQGACYLIIKEESKPIFVKQLNIH